MAETVKKKVYSIVINGLKESVDAVESLNKQLDNLDSRLKELSRQKINIKVDGNVTEPEKVKVSSGSTNTTVDKEKELAIQKQITAEIKAQGQYKAALTQEYQNVHKVVQQTKQDTKDMLSGAIDQARQYTNTMAGWKAELRDLTAERNKLTITKPEDVERFKQIQERANSLTTILKSIEQETGNFRRNVGNYPQLMSSLNTELENTERTIKAITTEMSNETAGSARYEKLSAELEIAQKHADELKKKLGEVGNEISKMPKVEIQVGDTVRQFDSLKQAAKELRSEYQQLVLDGKENTAEAENLAQAYGKVSSAMKNASGELNSYVGNAKGLSDVVEIMQGVTSIASIGTGIQGLFGGKSEAVDDALKKFANITMIMNGLTNLQKVMNDKTSIWGVILTQIWATSDKIVNTLTFGAFDKLIKATSSWKEHMEDVALLSADTKEGLMNQVAVYDQLVGKSADLKAAWDKLSESQKFIAEQLSEGVLTGDVELGDIPDDEVKGFLETLQKLKDVNPQLAESFEKVSTKIQFFTGNLTKGAAAMKLLPGWMAKAVVQGNFLGKAMQGVAIGFNFATVAVKTFAKATLILAAVQAAMELIDKTIDLLVSGFKYLGNQVASWFGSVGAAAGQTQASVDSLNATLEITNDRISQYNKEVDRMKNTGAITGIDALQKKTENLGKEITQAGNEFKTFIGTVDNLDKALKDNLGAIGAWYESGEKNVDGMMKRWEQLKKAVEAGTNEVAQGGSGWGMWYTASDAVDDFTDANKAMLQDLSNQINQIDFSKPEKAIEQFDNLFKGRLGGMRDYAARNIDKLFPDEPWAQMLNARLDQMKQFVESYKDLLNQTTDDSAALLKQAEKIIRDNTAAALPKNQRETQQSKNARADEIAAARQAGYDVETERKVIESINKKYDRQDLERRQSHAASVKKAGTDLNNVLKQIRDNELAAQKDGLDKRLQQLNNAMADEIAAARKGGVKVNELILSIEHKYGALIAKEKESWYRKQKEIQEKFNQNMLDNERNTWNDMIRVRDEMRVNLNQQVATGLETQNMKQTASVSYDFSTEGSDEGVKKADEYYKKLLEIQENYLSDKKALDLEAQQINYDNQLRALEAEYKEELITAERWRDEQNRQQKDYLDQGIINQEEYEQNIQRILTAYGEKTSTAYENYEAQKVNLTREKETEIARIEQEALKERQAAQKQYIDQSISELQTFYDKATENREEFESHNKTIWGFLMIKKEKASLKQSEQEYQQILDNIEQRYTELQQKLDNKEIDFNQFKEAKQELKKLEKATKDSLKKTQENLKNFSQTVAQNIADTVTMYMSQLYEVFQMFDDIMQAKFDAEQSELDHKQDLLDEENEQLEKYYQKAQEITQKYSDNINGIEDELKSARGERRQFLIDSLAQQKEAQLSALENENEIQRQKEANEKKQEQLKKKQDELDRKRRKQQKLANIASAVMSTAVAVTNALALQPFWVGIAMAAVAAAMGAVQIAMISKQKIYAKGGEIDGPSHKQSGVKIRTKKGIAEVEGKEFITNKETTQKNLPLMYYINSQRRELTEDDFHDFFNKKTRTVKPTSGMKFADGGTMPEMEEFDLKSMIPTQQEEAPKTYQVQVVDIINAMDNVETVKTLAGAA